MTTKLYNTRFFDHETTVLLVWVIDAVYFKELCIYYPHPILLCAVICQSWRYQQPFLTRAEKSTVFSMMLEHTRPNTGIHTKVTV